MAIDSFSESPVVDLEHEDPIGCGDIFANSSREVKWEKEQLSRITRRTLVEIYIIV